MADMKSGMAIKRITVELEDGTVKTIDKGIILGLEPVEGSEEDRKLTIGMHKVNPIEVMNMMEQANKAIKDFMFMDMIEKFTGCKQED